jgi:AhpD family alkylhydroperoxidase
VVKKAPHARLTDQRLAYCIDMHSRDLLKGGIAVEKMMLVSAWREAGDIFTDKEKAALQWAEAVTLISETHAPDEAFAAVSAQFQPKEISPTSPSRSA